MERTASSWRRPFLFSLALLAAGAPCCGGGDFAPASQITTLRILAVTADTPYAQPGDKVMFRLTYADSLRKDEPRAVQVTWIGGCVNPIGDEAAGCFPQFATVFEDVASGMVDPAGVFAQSVTMPEDSGVPDSVPFEMALPDDILAKPIVAPETGTEYSVAYAFFIACAGSVRPTSGSGAVALPLECVDDSGKVLGADSFVAGYTQVYVFADGRTNENPPVQGLTLEGEPIEDDPDLAPTVAPCAKASGTAERGGCSRQDEDECKTYELEALVDDVAEPDPEGDAAGAGEVREAVWVAYYADAGRLSGAKQLVHDTTKGYQKEHATTWTPPAEKGLVTLWAVVHDARGGASITRRFVRVE